MHEKEVRKKIIGERIKLIRNELGLTMKEFGKKFDPSASDSIVSRWERGISSPNNKRLKRIVELANLASVSMFSLVGTGEEKVEEYTPLILEEQQVVIDWARKLQANHFHFSSAIELLVSDKKSKDSSLSGEIEEVRKIYKGRNSAWRGQLLKALVLDRYRFEHDIQEGQVVTNGKIVGFACEVDYRTRIFELCARRDGTEFLGAFKVDDFQKVQ